MPATHKPDPIDAWLLGIIRNVWVWVGFIAIASLIILYLIIPTWDQAHRKAILDAYDRFNNARGSDIVQADDIVRQIRDLVRDHQIEARDLLSAWTEMDQWDRDNRSSVLAEKMPHVASVERAQTVVDITAASNAIRDRLGRGRGQEEFMGKTKAQVFSLLGNPDNHTVTSSGIGTIVLDDFQEGGYLLALTYVNDVVTQSSLIQNSH